MFLGAVCVTEEGTQRARIFAEKLLTGLLALTAVGLFVGQKGNYEAYRRWGRMQMLYNNKAYESVAEDYHSLHDKLKHKPEFLFEEAQCLSKTEQYTEAIQVWNGRSG